MDKRKEQLLYILIKEHISTGLPVGSSILVDKYKLDVSSATVRNEMASLEEDGYIMQPHISAGRVPTEKAYKKYIENLRDKKLKTYETKIISDCLSERSESSFKEAAKNISSLSGNTVFWAFHRHNLYYTGISNLFQQPEFREFNLVCDISAVIDKMEEIVDEVFDKINIGESIFIGSDNPFGDIFSSIFVKYKLNDNIGLFGLIGPLRMDYERNIALAKFINERIINK